MADPGCISQMDFSRNRAEAAISFAKEVIRVYQLTDLRPLLEAVERQTKNQLLNVAVFGRFKAGKSSFLNQLLRRPVLPVGVVPVTSVVTEICYAKQESATVIYRGGHTTETVPLTAIGRYVSELDNPGNRRGVETVRVFVPEMVAYQKLRLVDTPGLQSILAHNTETSFAWSPNVDLALVAVGVDPPLTQQDVELIERLLRFTPNVSVLLTKMDTLSPGAQDEVLAHRDRLPFESSCVVSGTTFRGSRVEAADTLDIGGGLPAARSEVRGGQRNRPRTASRAGAGLGAFSLRPKTSVSVALQTCGSPNQACYRTPLGENRSS